MTLGQAFAKTVSSSLQGKNGLISKTIYEWLAPKVIDNGITDPDLDNLFQSKLQNPYLQNPWVGISMRIRGRCFQRPPLKIYKPSGKQVEYGPLYDIFAKPGPRSFQAKLIGASATWWDAEDEIIWDFGRRHRGGIPEEIKVSRPSDWEYDEQTERWYYTDPIRGTREERAPESFFHCPYPSMFNKHRGTPRIVPLFLQLEQDYLTTLANTEALRNSAIPRGILETDQRLTQEQIKMIVDAWTNKYSRRKGNEQIGVAAYGAKFKPLNAELPRYLEFQENVKITTLTTYGIPLKVANATSEKTALSGKDSDEQYKAFWSQTILPEMHYIESAFHGLLFPSWGFDGYRAEWDWRQIPELEVDEADQHERLREDIFASLITLNEARAELHMDPVEWGDVPYHLWNKEKQDEAKRSFSFFTKREQKARRKIVLPIQGELFEEEA